MKIGIKKLISERESKMYHYYKSVFTEDFEGGYPIEYDEELLKVEQEVLKRVVGEIDRILTIQISGVRENSDFEKGYTTAYMNMRAYLSSLDKLTDKKHG